MVTLFFCSLLKYTRGLSVYWLSAKQLIFLTFYLKTNKVRNQIYTKLTVKIAKIKAPKEKRGINVVSVVNEDILNKWETWYTKNEERITWCEKKSKPKISFWRRLFG